MVSLLPSRTRLATLKPLRWSMTAILDGHYQKIGSVVSIAVTNICDALCVIISGTLDLIAEICGVTPYGQKIER